MSKLMILGTVSTETMSQYISCLQVSGDSASPIAGSTCAAGTPREGLACKFASDAFQSADDLVNCDLGD